MEEEEGGIEMSDDFEGNVHDMEREQNEDEESSGEEDNDMDQQMGDVEGDQEKFDKRIWGDSDDEEENQVLCKFFAF